MLLFPHVLDERGRELLGLRAVQLAELRDSFAFRLTSR